jgi:hypothetical protein
MSLGCFLCVIAATHIAKLELVLIRVSATQSPSCFKARRCDVIGNGPLPWRKAAEIAIAVAEGLAAAHSSLSSISPFRRPVSYNSG